MKNAALGILLFFTASLCTAYQSQPVEKKGKAKEEKTEEKQDKEDKNEPPKIGNFALPSTQQPGAFLSMGQNVIDKNQIQLYCLADVFQGSKRHNIDAIPAVVYGITNNLSAFFNIPIAISYKQDDSHSSGLEDMFLQFEYAISSKTTSDSSYQSTILANVTFPTGSTEKTPNTGIGAPSYFLGVTFDKTYVNWLVFTSYGGVLTTKRNETKYGNELLYQLGVGRNIYSIPSKWIFAWMVEADGQYTEKNKINGVKDPNSGGNVLFITPSMWISSNHLILQLGAGVPVIQHLIGTQDKNSYLLALNIGWTFGSDKADL